MNQRHAQPASGGRRPHQGTGKPARPGAHRRVQSSHNVHSQSHAGGRSGTAAARKAAAREEVQVETDEDGMAGLPQFCMTCERQIVNPGNSTLYCSRACQRRDSAKPASIDPLISPAIITAPSYFDVAQPDIIPQRSPTVLRPPSLTFSDLHISSLDHEDDDQEARSKRLSAYSVTNDPLDDAAPTSPLGRTRPHYNRSSTSTLPSLSHTPSSSVGTTASASFTYNTRPLPTRHEGHRSMRSADLVIPTFAGPSSVDAPTSTSVKSSASTLTSFQVAEAEAGAQDSWTRRARKQQPQSPSTAKGSLRQLFEHEAMASTPKGTR